MLSTPQADLHVKPFRPWCCHDSAPRIGPNFGLADEQKKRAVFPFFAHSDATLHALLDLCDNGCSQNTGMAGGPLDTTLC